ncbi:MAG: proline dehydrogenase [Gaiellaceae bacterium]|jgi:proline dehydrogenase|nr:proline dehydrogenase [Gaiellaceae bacterium]
MLILRNQVESRAVSLVDRAVVTLLPAVPKRVVRTLSSRYIAGSDLEDARRVVAELNAAGKLATVDVLGEEITRPEEAEEITRAYLDVLDAVDEDRLDANVSVKLTGLGLKLDPNLARDNLKRIAERGTFVRIDMEDSSTTDATLELYHELTAGGYGNLGVVLQAALKRTVDDAHALAGANVRLCKGIYIEPPEIAYRDFDDVRAHYVRALDALLDGGCYVGIATHDEWLIDEGRRAVRERGLTSEEYEFQMLLGVRRDLGDRVVADGHRLRLYVPYGRQWYEYSLRRLQENPKIAGYVAGDLGRSLFRRR